MIAIGIVANDISPHTIARCAGIAIADAAAAVAAAHDDGILIDGVITPADAVRLVGELPPQVVADIHTAVARHLLSEGPSRLLDAIGHARSAGTLYPSAELASIIDRAAAASLSVSDYESARQFLEFTHDIDAADPPEIRARRLCRLGGALDGLGRVTDARRRLAVAFDIAEMNGLTDLAVDAAVAYALPVDWYAGDRRVTAILQRAEALVTTHEQRVKVNAARAMAEMRIPVPSDDVHQVAWITRPTVAQPLADAAFADSTGCDDDPRLVALLAWRTTHRAPQYLEQRRAVSHEAADIAQRLRRPSRQVDAAVMLAVDALESADRPTFDHALTVLRWVADVDANPRLRWHAHAVAAGAAHIDGDLAAAERHRLAAREVGIAIDSPGWFGAELLLFGQELLARRDLQLIRQNLPDDAGAELLNPLGKLVVGLGHALAGDADRAEALLRRAIRQFDPEASWLLCLTRAVELAVQLDVSDVHDELWHQLEPWHDHVAIDSQAWFCDGPVSGWLAVLAERRGDRSAVRHYLTEAEPVARRLGDARTISRLRALRTALGFSDDDLHGQPRLTDRELTVLRLAVSGWTNPQIADELAFSASTIRNELSTVYRKLGVSTRAEAAAVAMRQGLVTPTGSPHA